MWTENPTRFVTLCSQSWKSDTGNSWVSAHIYSFNIGAPIEYAHNILHVSDHLPPYVAIACGFWFDEPMCSEYWARTICWYFSFGWNMAKNEVSIKNHKKPLTRSSNEIHQDSNIHYHDFCVIWYRGHLSAKRSPTTMLNPDVTLVEGFTVIQAMYR